MELILRIIREVIKRVTLQKKIPHFTYDMVDYSFQTASDLIREIYPRQASTRSSSVELARAKRVAERLGMPTGSITINPPTESDLPGQARGEPVAGGKVMFRGRAVDPITGDPDLRRVVRI